MSNIVAFGPEWRDQGPESVFTEEFWAERDLTIACTNHHLEVNEITARTYGQIVVDRFVQMAETRGHIMEWDTKKGLVRRLVETKKDPIYKEDVNWLELRDRAIISAEVIALNFK